MEARLPGSRTANAGGRACFRAGLGDPGSERRFPRGGAGRASPCTPRGPAAPGPAEVGGGSRPRGQGVSVTQPNSGSFRGRGGRGRPGGGRGHGAGPHSPFSRVCRFARTRRKVCREETRAKKCHGPRHLYVNNTPLAGKQGPARAALPPALHITGTTAPPPHTHLLPAPAAGPPPAALHSRGCRRRPAGQRGGGPRGEPPRAARDAGGYGAARQAPPISPPRPPPCWPRSCEPRREGESSPGNGAERQFP